MSDRSRLVVLSLPSEMTREKLLAHFATLNLAITDVKLLYNKEGRFRRMAFMGFQNNADACTAKDWFDGTWLAGSRIRVDIAQGVPIDAIRHRTTESPAVRVLPGQEDLGGHAVEDATSRTAGSKRSASAEILPESDAEYLAKRMRRQVGSEGNIDPESLDTKELQLLKRDSLNVGPEFLPSHVATVPQSVTDTPRRLFIRNLSYQATKENLRQMLLQYGELEEIYLPASADHLSKGIAFATFAQAADADRTRAQLDGRPFLGRLLHIMHAAERPGSRDAKETSQPPSKSYKLKKMKSLKSQADKVFNWSSLYTSSDSVLESLSSRHGLSKSAILDVTNADAAAQLALAESVLIQETKDYFLENGVNVDSLSDMATRSRTTLLIKNLPPGSTQTTLLSLLDPATAPANCKTLVAPSGTVAIAMFDSPRAASEAMAKLAYVRIGQSILYVERAPSNIWDMPTCAKSQEPPRVVGADTAPTGENAATHPAKGALLRTLFVGNLPLDCATSELVDMFKRFSGFEYAKIPDSALKRLDRSHQSTHFGFVSFSSPAEAAAAKEKTHGFVLRNQAVTVQHSTSSDPADGLAMHPLSDRSGTSKLLIKNLPFEVSKKDVHSVLSPFGRILNLRIPQNGQGRSRGFAFVQFAHATEAFAAKKALSHTHIMGRHLVIEDAL